METLQSAGIVIEKPALDWEEIIGLDEVKQKLLERVVLPVKFPQLFQGCRRPFHTGILLFGPRGSGKSSLVKAVASRADGVSLFTVPCADFVSQRKTDAEKVMQELFQVAKEHKPCVIHFDEIHALFGSSVADDSEIEWVRRMKTEFLVQVEQLSHDSIGIFIIASTHKPWLLDTFVRRRLNIRIYTPLPDVQARALIFKQKLGTAPHSLIDEDFWFLAESSEGFSGTDIKIVVRDALMQPGRKVQAATHFRNVSGTSKNSNGIIDDLLTPCSLVYPGAIAMRFSQVPPNKLVEPGVEKTDILKPLQTHKVTVTAEDLAKLQQFYDDYVAY